MEKRDVDIRPGANLYGADLRGADLQGADLRKVTAVIGGGCPNGWEAFAWWQGGNVVVSVGCHTKTLVDARAYWQGKADRREVMAFLDYAETLAKLREGGGAPRDPRRAEEQAAVKAAHALLAKIDGKG